MNILLFGIAKDIVGQSELTLDAEKALPQTVAQLKEYLFENYPEFRNLTSLAVAVNSEFAQADSPLQSHDEIAIIPPVSGG